MSDELRLTVRYNGPFDRMLEYRLAKLLERHEYFFYASGCNLVTRVRDISYDYISDGPSDTPDAS